jgi:periplasmic divalent cation tolerance protein
MSSDVLVVLSTLPTDKAELIAETLVTERLAACVNLVGPVRSIYRWDGAIQKDTELLAVIKTTTARYEAMATRLRALHPYEVPEIIALPVGAGYPRYLDWVRTEVAGP